MHDRFGKMLGKKRDLSNTEHKARMDVVRHLRDDASGDIAGRLDGLKKVSVTSDSQEGLKKGLDKAKEIVSSPEMEAMKNHAENAYGDLKSAEEEHERDEDNEESMPLAYAEGGEVEGSPEEEAAESDDEEAAESDESQESDDDMSEEEIDQKLAELMAKKKQLEAKKS